MMNIIAKSGFFQRMSTKININNSDCTIRSHDIDIGVNKISLIFDMSGIVQCSEFINKGERRKWIHQTTIFRTVICLIIDLREQGSAGKTVHLGYSHYQLVIYARW